MSRVKDLKRQLDAACEAIESLDADLATGALAAGEHAGRRAEREAEAGRLLVALRRVQRESRDRRAEEEPAAAAPPSRAWLGNPLVLAALALLVVGAGVGAGVALGLRSSGTGGAPAATTAAVPPGAGLTGAMSEMELQTLRQIAAREDAPTASLLQLAHADLDQGRLDQARRLYERVLAREPKNAEAITHLGGVLYQEGRVDQALARVEEALRLDPRYIHAHWDRAHYLFQGKRDYRAAIAAGEAFLRLVPEGPDAEQVKSLMAEARKQVAAAPKR